jgi:hypothetical protein
MTNSEEKREMIFEAMGLIEAAKELLDEAVRGTEIERNYLGYGRYGIDTLLGDGNPYDDGIDTIMNSIESDPDPGKFQVTKKFLGGLLDGFQKSEITSVEMKVGLVVLNPVAGSPYKVVSCELIN